MVQNEKPPPPPPPKKKKKKIVSFHIFKRFDQEAFMEDIENAPWSVCSVFDDPDDCYWLGHTYSMISVRCTRLTGNLKLGASRYLG